MSASHHQDIHNKYTLGGILVTLGIIFGDIGTSPLYVMKAIIGTHAISTDVVLGGISAIFWTLTLQTTMKYVIITLSADNHTVTGTFQFEVQSAPPSPVINTVIAAVLAAAVLTGIGIFIRSWSAAARIPPSNVVG